MFKKVLILVAVLTVNLATAKSLITFSGNKLPEFIKCKNSKVKISDRHALNGDQSLRWDWKNNASLTFNVPIKLYDKKIARKMVKFPAFSTFSFWVYNEKPLKHGKLRIEIGKKGRVNSYFDFYLNFSGWRTCWVAYDRDMKGKAVKDMDFIRIKAPGKIKSGTLFFDRIIPSTPGDKRYNSADRQVPFVNPGNTNHWTPQLKIYATKAQKLKPLTARDKADFAVLEKRLGENLYRGWHVKNLAALKKEFAKAGISEKNGIIKGRHVKYVGHDSIYKFIPEAKKAAKTYLDMRRYYGTMLLELALAWKKNPESADAKEIAKMFVMAVKHMLDQGWAAESSLGTMHHYGYNTYRMFTALFLMRPVLKKAGILEELSNMTQWYSNIRYVFNKKIWPKPDADFFNTMSVSSLQILAMMPDTPEKAAAIKAFSKMYSHILGMESPGWMGGFKADGCVYHHWGNYPGYGFPAIRGAARICAIFAGTKWAISKKAMSNLERALMTAELSTNPNLPLALCGRHPFGKSKRLRTTNGMESAFKDIEKATGKNIKPVKTPQGHWSFNYGCYGIHRYKDKMVTLKGYNHYVWSSETYKRDNRFGRYQSNGSIEIMPKSGSVSAGRVQAGWDWSRNPGTTALYRTAEELNPPNYTVMLTSPSRISGSSNLENKYGMLGVELSEPKRPKFDPSFRAVKSIFCFDDRIVSLGSGIKSDSKLRVETILTQYNIKDGSVPVYFNSDKAITKLPYKVDSNTPAWLADAFGNAWFVVSGGKINVVRQKQSSPHNKTLKISSGNFTAAWIEHGVKPKNAKYEYLLLIDTTPEKAAKYAEKMKSAKTKPYKVLACSNKIQAVKDRASNVTAAVFFQPAKKISWGPLKAVYHPAYIMFKPEENDKLSLSINTPNLADFYKSWRGEKLSKAELQARKVSILLDGKWTAQKLDKRAKIRYSKKQTIIIGEFRHGIPMQLKLQRPQ